MKTNPEATLDFFKRIQRVDSAFCYASNWADGSVYSHQLDLAIRTMAHLMAQEVFGVSGQFEEPNGEHVELVYKTLKYWLQTRREDR